MFLTPHMTIVLVASILCFTALTLHGDLPAIALTHLVSGIVGAFAPGTIRQIKASMHPPPMPPPPDF